jgi:hypothetical protein
MTEIPGPKQVPYLNVFTRTPFVAHSTARLDAMCFTAMTGQCHLSRIEPARANHLLSMRYTGFAASQQDQLSPRPVERVSYLGYVNNLKVEIQNGRSGRKRGLDKHWHSCWLPE